MYGGAGRRAETDLSGKHKVKEEGDGENGEEQRQQEQEAEAAVEMGIVMESDMEDEPGRAARDRTPQRTRWLNEHTLSPELSPYHSTVQAEARPSALRRFVRGGLRRTPVATVRPMEDEGLSSSDDAMAPSTANAVKHRSRARRAARPVGCGGWLLWSRLPCGCGSGFGALEEEDEGVVLSAESLRPSPRGRKK